MNDSNDLENFELLLKKSTYKRPIALYSDNNSTNSRIINPEDVLDSVYSQIKKMQSADRSSTKKAVKDFEKSSFLSINNLPVYHEASKESNTFDTQCVSDTQLINIIDDAEAIIDKGMTQEFNTDFSHTNVNIDNAVTLSIDKQNNDVSFTLDKTEKENTIEIQEFETTFTNTNVEDTISFIHDNNERDATHGPCNENDQTQVDKPDVLDHKNVDTLIVMCDKVIDRSKYLTNMLQRDKQSTENDNSKDLSLLKNPGNLNKGSVNTECENKIVDTIEDVIEIINEEKPPSPILKVKIKSKIKTESLVVPLESFERFEKIAIPLVDSNNDFNTCKHLINSQILGGELYLNTNEDVIFNENDQLSPIIERGNEIFPDKENKVIKTNITLDGKGKRDKQSDSLKDEILFSSDEENEVIKTNITLDGKDKIDKQSDSLKDEILFSSDEENDFIYKEFRDMPLTAALETSFYDHSNVFEETLYVGFQTASNKSIQISTDSFKKAQFILDEDENINKKDFSLAELEICDEKSINNKSLDLKLQESPNLKGEGSILVVNKTCDMTQINLNEKDQNEDVEMIDASETKILKAIDYENTIKMLSEKENFTGFKTASNKNIDLSVKALNICKNVFKDIDIDEKFNLTVQNNVVSIKETKNMRSDNTVTNYDTKVAENNIEDKINDDLIIQEFENIEMSLEDNGKNTVPFLGFKTASNRDIGVSDAAKTKIKEVFQDTDLRERYEEGEEISPQTSDINKKVYPEASFVGFKTANNKNISISAKALAKTKSIFQDIDNDIDKSFDDDLKKYIQTLDQSNRPSTSKSAFVGVKTANNENIEVSDVALTKSCKIFQDIDKENYKDDQVVISKKTCEGFKTASNKTVNISKQALIKSKKLLDDIEEGNGKNNKNSKRFPGFKTANDNVVTISEESVTESKKLFIDWDTNKQISYNNRPSLDTPKNDRSTFKGFQTANSNPVSVSTEALGKSKAFKDIIAKDVNTDQESNFKKTKKANNEEFTITKEVEDSSKKLIGSLNNYSKSFVGFKTASNKDVNISKEALAKCKKIFEDLDDLPAENNLTIVPKITANDKPVEFFKGFENNKAMDDGDLDIKEYTFKGFKTASKKEVHVSYEALEKTKIIFKGIDESNLKEPKCSGFQTGNNKKVSISKETIEKTKTLFDDIHMMETKTNTFKGFQTASKKKVYVSEEALIKSKQVLQSVVYANDDVIKNKDSDVNTVKASVNSMFSSKTANNQNVTEDMKKTRIILNPNIIKHTDDLNRNNTEQIDQKIDKVVNLDNIINTQVLNNFEETLCTEDFNKTPNNKRAGSPILSCPRAKRRKKFETPYKDEKEKITKNIITSTETKNTSIMSIKFSENYKSNKIYKLKDIKRNITKNDTDPYITNFNMENLLNFEFKAERNEISNTKMTVEDLKSIFLNSVNKNLVPEGWLEIHLKLILWKLIMYEVKFQNPTYLCTVQNVIDQLKYRYDKELYNAERPALRKVFERDDIPSRTIVLCVAGIDGAVNSATNTKDMELLLTDGWYFIKCVIDKMLSKLVSDGKILIGCKIVTSGAELINCDQGLSPWEDTSAVRLKIFGNSTRPAPWDARLGYSRGAILNQLSAVKVDGGKITRMKVYVTRVYPMLYVEKFADGSTVTRSERLEHLHQMKYEAERELMMERIYEEVQKEFSDQESQDTDISESERRCWDSGSQIAKMMKHSKDPIEFRAHLSASQIHLLQDHTCKHRERVLRAIEIRVQDKMATRNVVSLARGRIAGIDNQNGVTKGMLSIWKPNDAILDLFKEGNWIEIMNTVPTAMRYSEIQITAGRQSVFRQTKCKNENIHTLKRICYNISDVTNNPTMTTDYNEIDTVGMVFLIEPSYKEFDSNNNFQNVYISDADKNIISMYFWGGVKKFGFENILDIGQVVACANLQKRAGNTRKNIPQFRVTEFSYFTKTPKNVQAREIMNDLDRKLFGLDRRKFCDDCIVIKSNFAALRCQNNNENNSPYKFNNTDYSFTRNKMFIDTPKGVTKNVDMNLNLTGLDFESSFRQTQELSPKTIVRKRKVNEKIAKLKMYGEPPPLTSLSIINNDNTKNSYMSPLSSGNLNAAQPRKSVAIVNNLPEDSPKREDREKSPVISAKRTYVRSIPVKLNFANEGIVDNFAEEFDASPPLSLD